MTYKALLVGNSAGTGLATTKRLLAGNRDIIGISKSESTITNKAYHHRVADVSHSNYPESLNDLLSEGPSAFATLGVYLELRGFKQGGLGC